MTKIDNFVNRNKGKIALISLLSGILTIACVYFAYNRVYAETINSATLSSDAPQIAESCVKGEIEAYVWCLLKKEGLTLEERIKAVSIISCESKWNQYAIGVNKNSLDLGLVQLNTQYYKNRECSFSIECSVKKMVEIYRQRKNWTAWVCS